MAKQIQKPLRGRRPGRILTLLPSPAVRFHRPTKWGEGKGEGFFLVAALRCAPPVGRRKLWLDSNPRLTYKVAKTDCNSTISNTQAYEPQQNKTLQRSYVDGIGCRGDPDGLRNHRNSGPLDIDDYKKSAQFD